jgi:DNA-binding NarL/FixJ family response regulator
LATFSQTSTKLNPRLFRLGPRAKLFLELLLDGRNSTDIAKIMGVSKNTVSEHGARLARHFMVDETVYELHPRLAILAHENRELLGIHCSACSYMACELFRIGLTA